MGVASNDQVEGIVRVGNKNTPEWLKASFPDLSGLEPIGLGGQKAVFAARHATEGPVVLKIFHAHARPERALREVEAIRSIGSSHIPIIYALGTAPTPSGEVLWVREQRVPGETLREVLQRGPLDIPTTLLVGMHVLETVAAAAEVRIVHRDIKPENIIYDSAGQRSWLLDFGIARHLDLESLTRTVDVLGLGTVGYASPEQFRNLKRDIDSRSDLFSLGVTLYECIEGRNPFTYGARDAREAMRRLERDELPLLATAPQAVADFISACTRKRRDHRPRSASEALAWMRDLCIANGVNE